MATITQTAQMQVKGLEKDVYFTGNPIWVDVLYIKNSTKFVSVSITPAFGETVVLNLYPINGKVYFDLAQIIKGYFPTPQHPEHQLFNGEEIKTNYLKAQITIQQVSGGFTGSVDSKVFVKDFIRASEEGQGTNIGYSFGVSEANTSVTLKDSELLPRWTGYPFKKYALTSDRKIRAYSIVGPEEVEQRRVIGCNPIYVRFLNSKGGYSYWLFEKWNVEKSAGKTEQIYSRNKYSSTGNSGEHKITFTSRVEERYFKMMRALITSPEVHVYRLDELYFNEGKTSIVNVERNKWTRLFNTGDKIGYNNFSGLESFSITFDLPVTSKTNLKW